MRHDVRNRGVRLCDGVAVIGMLAALTAAAGASAAPPPKPAARAALAVPASSEEAFLRAEGKRDTTGLAVLAKDTRPAVRARAARALGHIGNRGSRPLLEAALSDPSAAVRREAAFGLGLVTDSLAVRAVLDRLSRETDPATRVALVTTLGNLGSRSSAAVGRSLDASLRSPRAPERWAAAFAAARLRDSSLVEPLERASRDTHADLRWRSAYALGRIGDRRGAPALRKLTYDKDAMVRAVSARAIGEVGDSTATARLGALLHDESWRVRVNAAAALGTLRIARESRTLLPHLNDAHPHVRWQAAISLGAMRDSLAVPALTRALGDSSTGVVQAAAISLLRIQGDRAVPTIAPALDLLPAFLRGGLAEALGDVEGPLARDLLLARAAQSSDPAQSAGSASALAKRPEARGASLPVLRPLLQDRDFSVVCSAAEALGTLRDSASVAAISALFTRHTTTQDDDVRASAATALVSIGTAEARTALRPALRDTELRVRETAARGLGLPPDSIAGGPAPPLKARATPATERRRLTALVTTERGAITIALDPSAAPENVENFASLARAGYFDGIQFHRVVPNFVIQTGCPRGDGWGGPGHAIPCEYDERPYEVGTVGMALAGKDTGGSQWFVTLSPQPRLEGRYTILGKVTQGLDVTERIMPGDRILKVTIR